MSTPFHIYNYSIAINANVHMRGVLFSYIKIKKRAAVLTHVVLETGFLIPNPLKGNNV